MIPAAFEYYRPKDMDKVLSILEEHGDDARVMSQSRRNHNSSRRLPREMVQHSRERHISATTSSKKLPETERIHLNGTTRSKGSSQPRILSYPKTNSMIALTQICSNLDLITLRTFCFHTMVNLDSFLDDVLANHERM